ncbi:MAG: hypothetical protein ACLQME_11540 [Alphaproteobacteria bacterium]
MQRLGMGKRIAGFAGALASRGWAFAPALLLVLAFNLYWYGAFLSFPVFGEDAASLLYVLLDTIKGGHLATIGYPMNWSEGLGQPNLFITFTFDPFAWVMLLPLDPADCYRISMALRATAAWAAGYWFCIVLFRGRPMVAMFSATLYILIGFILTSAWGTYIWAGMFNATHAAIFPLLGAFALLIMRSPRRIGIADLCFLVSVFFFILDYPVGSLIGIAVFLTFAGAAALLARPAERRTAIWGFAKIAAMVAILLFAPPLHIFSSWTALIQGSARVVFSGELFAYGNSHVPPLMWTRSPWALRVCILVGLSVLLLNRRWPRPLRVLAATLFLVVGGVQLLALVKYLGLDAGLVDRLPRLHYFEFYSPLFYAACGGFALSHWRDVAFPGLADRRHLHAWTLRTIMFLAIALYILPTIVVVVSGILLIVAHAWLRRERKGVRSVVSPVGGRLVARAVFVALIAAAIGTWLPPSEKIYPIFYAESRCRDGVLWCRDPPGATMAVGDNPITQYLRRALSADEHFSGRAETWVRPPVRIGLYAQVDMRWTDELFARLHAWYARAYEAQVIKGSSEDDLFRLPPQRVDWDRRQYLLDTLAKFARGDLPYNGPAQENLVLEMRDWIVRRGQMFGLFVKDFTDPWQGINSVQAVTEERTAAFFATGNGLLLRAMPFQGVPVASSYEQALDYLYYLFWTRYVSAGQAAFKSINMTTLEALHPDRLALAGIRFVVARDSSAYEAPPLERIMSWQGYSIYAVRHANVAGYAVKNLEFGNTLTEELRLMRHHGFDPRRTAVLPARARRSFADSTFHAPGMLASSSIRLAPNELTYLARGSGGPVFVVLPFNWSHCWQVEWRRGTGNLTRADIDLVGVAFEGDVELHLRWTAGYGARSQCLGEDQTQIPEAKRAAAAVGFGQAYEPLDRDFQPFAAARPRFAADAVDERELERRSDYSSGNEMVVPSSVVALLSNDELYGGAWTTSVSSEFRRDNGEYELVATNDGGASLAVLPLRHSYCWQAEWRGKAGALLPVDADRLSVLFRGSTSVRLLLPPADERSSCALRDRARAAVFDFLANDPVKSDAARYRLGEAIAFGSGGNSESFTVEGWGQPEAWGRWSLGSTAKLVLRTNPPPTGDLILDASVGALLAGSRRFARATIVVNGVEVGKWEFRPEDTPGRRQATVPRDLVADIGVMVIDFKVDEPVSPAELAVSLDTRRLGLSLQRLTVRAADSY